MPEPAILYARYSPRPIKKHAKRHFEEHNSIEVQIARMEAYCKMQGLEPLAIVKDPEVSARKIPFAEREGGAKVISLLRKGVANHIVAQKLDRFFRDLIDGATQIREWNKQGVIIHLADEEDCTLNTKRAAGRAMLHMRLTMTQFEADQTGERTSATMQHLQSSGHRVSNHTPYGKMVDPMDQSRLVDDPDELDVIALIHDLHENDNLSDRAICRMLQQKGIKGRGGKWNHSMIGKILRRERV